MFTGSKVSKHHISIVHRIAVGISVPCVYSISDTDAMRQLDAAFVYAIGEKRFALLALLLLTLPLAFTFHVLYALPRLAERRRTF